MYFLYFNFNVLFLFLFCVYIIYYILSLIHINLKLFKKKQKQDDFSIKTHVVIDSHLSTPNRNIPFPVSDHHGVKSLFSPETGNRTHLL